MGVAPNAQVRGRKRSKFVKNVQKSVTNVRESEKKCAENVEICKEFFTPLRI
jgi:hypothetical protein